MTAEEIQKEVAKPNGVVRFGGRGKNGIVTFAIGDDGPEFKIDVIRAWEEWVTVDRNLRDAEGVLPKEQFVAWAGSRASVAQEIIDKAYEQLGVGTVPKLTGAEVEQFMARLQEEVEKLRVFTEPRSPSKPSSQGNSEIRFQM